MERDVLKENYNQVRENIRQACLRSRRSIDEVTLIAVSKTKPISMIQHGIELGMTNFGENKPQEIRDKCAEITAVVQWHMIGHLQKNKIKYIVPNCSLIHSVDSIELARNIQAVAEKKECHVHILLQMNVSGEKSKQGFTVETVEQALESISQLSHVHVQGLMTIAPYVANSEQNRHLFRQLNELYIDIKSKNIDNVSMNVLSMGMTGDYEVAIEEGATHIRVGTGLFGQREQKNNKTGR